MGCNPVNPQRCFDVHLTSCVNRERGEIKIRYLKYTIRLISIKIIILTIKETFECEIFDNCSINIANMDIDIFVNHIDIMLLVVVLRQ